MVFLVRPDGTSFRLTEGLCFRDPLRRARSSEAAGNCGMPPVFTATEGLLEAVTALLSALAAGTVETGDYGPSTGIATTLDAGETSGVAPRRFGRGPARSCPPIAARVIPSATGQVHHRSRSEGSWSGQVRGRCWRSPRRSFCFSTSRAAWISLPQAG